jgi:hypothetical protein
MNIIVFVYKIRGTIDIRTFEYIRKFTLIFEFLKILEYLDIPYTFFKKTHP